MVRFLAGLAAGAVGAAITSFITTSTELITIVGIGLAFVVWLRAADLIWDVIVAVGESLFD